MSMQWAQPLICEARSLTSSSSEWSSPQFRTNMCRPIIAFSPCGDALRKSSRAFIALSSISRFEQLLRIGAVHRMGEAVERPGGAQVLADFLDQRHHGKRGARRDGDAADADALKLRDGRRAGARYDVDR